MFLYVVIIINILLCVQSSKSVIFVHSSLFPQAYQALRIKPNGYEFQYIIVEGFNKSLATHGVKYTTLIGDGDSSVMKNLVEKVSYGSDIEKVA